VFPSILELPSALQESDAFEVVHAELDQSVQSGADRGVVLLESTGRTPKAIPTQMNANTLVSLSRCMQARGPRLVERIRSAFPNGITGPSGILRVSD
jgi:hypothetical protein